MNFFFISWQQLHQDCFKLSQRILKKNLHFDRIVCISRGGLVVTRIFSDFLDLPISNFTIVSYTSVGITGIPKITDELSINIKNERILLIDEIVDHGTTLKKAITYLKKHSPKQITILAPYIKSWSQPKPSFWQVKSDKWVIFPYEVKETVDDLTKIFKKQGKTKTEINKIILNLGFDKKQISAFSV